MKKLLLVLVVLALAPAPALAQVDVVSVQVADGEVCPVGWTTGDQAWTKPARIFYVLPDALVAAYRRTHIRAGSPEFQVTPAFVSAVFPTDQLREAAFTAGRLRSEPATSGSVRTCSLP